MSKPYTIDSYDIHEKDSTSIINPLKNSFFDPKHFTFESPVVNFVSLMFCIIIMVALIYAVYLTFDTYAFTFSLIAIVCVFVIRPDILELVNTNPVLQYYTLLITWTLINTLNDYTNSQNYLFLAILNMTLSVISFLTRIKWFVAVSIYLNIYMLLLVAVLFRNNQLIAS